jgi:galactokinase/mevalonate kinase-like predicted kinase
MKSLTIPDSLSVQMLSLKTPSKFVYLVLGTDDGIKKPIHDSTLYGVNFLEILMKTELSMEDIFSSGDIAKGTACLWTAKIHPVVSSSDSDLPSFESLFGWINLLRSASYQGIVQSDPSFQSWLSLKRVSLKDLHGLADAGMEWVYRNMLEQLSLQLRMGKTIAKTTILLRQRCHDQSCDDLMWLTEIANRDVAIRHLMGFVSAMNQSAVSELKLGNDDISGRYLMLASTAIAEFAERLEMDIELNHEVLDKCNVLVQKLKHSSTYFTAAKRRVEIVEQVLLLASTCVGDVKEPSISTLSIILEKLALCLVECTISDGFRQVLDPASDGSNLKIYFERTESPVFDKWVVSTAPVRVDLAGGWSDTPPICYENGGSVTGMALLVDDNFPLLSRCRIVQGGTGISIRSEIRNGSDHSLSLCQEVRIDDSISLDDFRTPTSECALSKACLVCLGMATEEQLQCSTDLQKLLNAFCGTTDNVGMEIVTTSLIGMGSGMGTSSILAACVLSSISKCVGIGDLKHELIIHAVLMVEQLLSSGGGWQDQAHGISPGMKTVRSQPPKIPLTIQSEPLDLSTTQIDAFEERLVFVFTGKTRLAKNILQQVLRRWSKRTDEIVKTVHGLVDASENLRKAALNGDWDAVAECMDKSFHLKCVMAGESSGALPRTVNLFVEELKSRDLIKGAMLCGAGGGGFLLMIATEGTNRRTIEDVFKTEILCLETEFTDFTFHGCSIATQGLATEVLVDDDEVSLQSHSLSWHRMR